MISLFCKSPDRREHRIKALRESGLKLPTLTVDLGSHCVQWREHGLDVRSTGLPGKAVQRPPCKLGMVTGGGSREPGRRRAGAQGALCAARTWPWLSARGRPWLPRGGQHALSLSHHPVAELLSWTSRTCCGGGGRDAFPLNRRLEGHHSLVMASLPHTRLAADAGAGFRRVTAVPGHTL